MSNTLYLLPFTLYSNVAVLLLWEKGVQDQYTQIPVDLETGENNQPDYIRLNPEGKVPVLVHQGRSIPDSLAIARFLDPTETLKPNDPAVLALVEKFRQISLRAVKYGEAPQQQNDEILRQHLDKVRAQLIDLQAQHGIYERRITLFDARTRLLTDPDAYQAQKRAWDDLLDHANAILASQSYLVGDQYTLADVYAVAFLFSATTVLADPLFANRPHLEKYYQAQWTRPAVVGAYTRPSS